jgi:hypothetical protein
VNRKNEIKEGDENVKAHRACGCLFLKKEVTDEKSGGMMKKTEARTKEDSGGLIGCQDWPNPWVSGPMSVVS